MCSLNENRVTAIFFFNLVLVSESEIALQRPSSRTPYNCSLRPPCSRNNKYEEICNFSCAAYKSRKSLKPLEKKPKQKQTLYKVIWLMTMPRRTHAMEKIMKYGPKDQTITEIYVAAAHLHWHILVNGPSSHLIMGRQQTTIRTAPVILCTRLELGGCPTRILIL